MATITKDSLENLFKKIDSKLDAPVDIYIIGGAAAILGYNIIKQTDDVDLDGYRERMSHFTYPKKKLRVWSLNQYDLAISKASRGLGKDFDDIQKIHQVAPFNYEKPVLIFNTEFIRVSAVGNQREQKMNFLDLVQKLLAVLSLPRPKKTFISE